MIKKTLCLLLLLVLSGFIQAEKLAELDLAFKGWPIIRMNSKYYVISGKRMGEVHLYRIFDYKKSKKFGKIGEGPGDFIQNIRDVILTDDCIFIMSLGKFSVYDLEGTFIKDFRVSPGLSVIGIVGNHFLCEKRQFSTDGIIMKYQYLLLNKDLTEYRTILATEKSIDPYKKDYLQRLVLVTRSDTHFVVAEQRGKGAVTVYDQDAKPIKEINYAFEEYKLTDKDKSELKDVFSKEIKELDPPKEYIGKFQLIIPEIFPPFSSVDIDRDRLLVYTNKVLDQQKEILFFNLKGQYLGKKNYPINQGGIPIDGYFYKLEENQETETWELHRFPIGEPLVK